jgi:hypothetical protein
MAERTATTAARSNKVKPFQPSPSASVEASRDGYVVPILHTQVSERVVNLGFWGALGASAAFGVVDLPLAVLIGAGVLVARHRSRH